VSPSAVLRGLGEQVSAHQRRIRLIAGACYLVVLAVATAVMGIPLSRTTVFAWTLAALAIYCIGRGWRLLGQAFLDWVPFCAVMVLYDFSRGAADRLGQPVHVGWPAAVDRWMFGVVPSVWLQHRFYVPGVAHWYDVAASLVYFSFFFTVPLTMAVLWLRSRPLWRRFTANVVAVSFASLATYLAFPEAPPWYAAHREVIGPISRISSLGWTDIGLRATGDVIEHGQAIANDVAAMPSVHIAYSMIVALFLARRMPGRLRALPMVYPAAMGLALVYTGEHYVVDLIAGVLYVVVIDLAVALVMDRAAARARSRPPDIAPAAGRTPHRRERPVSPETARPIGPAESEA
jgi:hypothetical protein